ncbi:MAG: AAA family ATPase [Planctomycetota bacterium]
MIETESEEDAGQAVRHKVLERIRHMAEHAIIRDRRFLDDEQLVKSEQLALLDQIYAANVRDAELQELSSHFAGILRGDSPVHLAVWGKTGTGKTLTLTYFLNLLSEMAGAEGIAVRHQHLDLSTPRPCFRALNDLACLMGASRRYKKGISLEELMLRIEAKLAEFRGYLILFIDEIDNVRRDRDALLSFLVRRLPQRIPAKLVLVFVSNKLNWTDNIDPRVQSFLKLNELIFKPYDAIDLRTILSIRVQKSLAPNAILPGAGVVERIAALASREHGDARRAVGLLSRSAYLAEKAGRPIDEALVDQAAAELDTDRYLSLLRSAPAQLRAAMWAVIDAVARNRGAAASTRDAHAAYRRVCERVGLRALTGRAFGDLVAELDMYSLVTARVQSKGRYGRSRQISIDLPPDLVDRITEVLRLSFDGG